MSNHLLFFESIREKKRVRNEVSESLTRLECASLKDLESVCSMPNLSQSHVMALLVLRFGVLSLVLAKYAINKFPAMLHSDVKEEILRAIFPSHTPAEVNLLISHISKVSDFINNSVMDEQIQRASEVTNIPFQDILCPPVESCVKCRGTLSLHNKPANVTIFKLSGPVRGIKISLKCSACGIVYKYAQHGKQSEGYLFYPERQLLVEGSNVAYLERQLCLYQVSLRYCIYQIKAHKTSLLLMCTAMHLNPSESYVRRNYIHTTTYTDVQIQCNTNTNNNTNSS